MLAACAGPPPATGDLFGGSKELVRNNDASLLRVAEIARENADYPAAVRLYKTLLQKGDNRAEVHLGLADCLFLTGAYTDALAQYHVIDERSEKFAEAEIGIGRTVLALHQPTEAKVAFDGALKRLPTDQRALNGNGVALDNLGRHDEAQIYYQRGLAVAPADRVLRNNYGLSLALSGDYTKAVAILRPLTDEPGATARNRQNLALALALGGNRTEAAKIAQIDLDAASVTSNMRFYDSLRTEPPAVAAAALPVGIAQSAPEPTMPVIAPAPRAAVTPPAEAPPTVIAMVEAPPATPPPSRPAAVPNAARTQQAAQFGIQLAVYQKVSGIAGGWKKYQSGFADIMGKLEPRVAMVDLGDGRGPLYRLKAGPFGNAAAAETVCRRLKAKGSDCKVSDFDGTPATEYWQENVIE
jgi:Flp pilus assembly protein TadD